ncbi:efflux RND transporter permease subunit [bacterium]|nr:efflux RND transporter permease subunit [bacterium]
MSEKTPFTQRIVEVFLAGNLSIILILLSLLCGAVALWVTPREEEPQIVVPLADVFISAPGLSVEEVEKNIATRLEKLLYQIDGVEYVYSMSRPGQAIVTVRFYVGEDREDSLVKIHNKLQSNLDRVHASITGWVVKPLEIDDVPIVNLTLWSERPEEYSDYHLRRIAEELEIRLQSVPNTNRVEVLGGRPRVVRVELSSERLAAHTVSALEIARALAVSNAQRPAGGFSQTNRAFLVDAGVFLDRVSDVGNLVVGVHDGRPVYLRDVAEVIDGPDELEHTSWIGFGPADETRSGDGAYYPAVHLAVAKKRGSNAVTVARAVEKKVAELEKTLLPDGVHARTTRNYGETANHKVNELVENLAVAIVIVIGLIAFTLGWREALIVAVAVPITFSLTLLVNYLFGYTINRVTLFALTLALGLVVDDPIVDVENIYRHLRMGRESPLRAVLSAVNEVRPPIILATLAVIVSFVPMFFITGMMGPYMRPMALNVPLSMLMSLVVAFTITPWMSYHMLKREARPSPPLTRGAGGDGAREETPLVLERTLTYRVYSSVLRPFLASRLLAWGLLAVTAGLFSYAVWLAAARQVPLKMLPFDNKNEFQLVLDMPEGTTLETTDAAARALGEALRSAPEVVDFQIYCGMASAMDFNGLVRHYYLRTGPNVADLRVNLLPKRRRMQQSHEILLRLRPELEEVAAAWGGNLKLVEVPPGPPVISTLTVEVYGALDRPYSDLAVAARRVEERLRREPFVVDVDSTVEDRQTKWVFTTDKEKAALSGVSTADVAETVALALAGKRATSLHVKSEVNPLDIVLRLPLSERSSLEDLRSLYLKGQNGPMVQLGALGEFRESVQDQTIYHKNLERVVYVFAEMAGRAPAEAVVDAMADLVAHGASLPAPLVKGGLRALSERTYYRNGGGDGWSMPPGTRAVWNGEGEWKITLDVFRDLGVAFGAACIGIYILLIFQTGSYFMPLILMISIPLTMIGIMPGFYLLNLFTHPVAGYPNPVFFTATAMIGMIALSGIAVRNAILLIEFVHEALRRGESLSAALLSSGAVRFRPIFLTAGTSLLAAWPITLDPIFSGLAWALIFGLFVSTAFTLLVIPIVYDLVYRNRQGHGLPPAPLAER